jgi:hypothetical protein
MSVSVRENSADDQLPSSHPQTNPLENAAILSMDLPSRGDDSNCPRNSACSNTNISPVSVPTNIYYITMMQTGYRVIKDGRTVDVR